jgi:hypothetical protein
MNKTVVRVRLRVNRKMSHLSCTQWLDAITQMANVSKWSRATSGLKCNRGKGSVGWYVRRSEYNISPG